MIVEAAPKLAIPVRLSSCGSHTSVEVGQLLFHPPSHGAQKPKKTMMIWINIRRRNSIALARMFLSRAEVGPLAFLDYENGPGCVCAIHRNRPSR